MASRHRNDFTRGYQSLQSVGRTVRQLKEIGEHVLAAAKVALKEGVDGIVEEAKHRVPRRTGKLQESVKAVAKNAGAEYVFQANAPALNHRGIPYGQFVEFDPRIGGSSDGFFLYPAFRAGRASVREKIKDAIRAACNRGQ